MSQELSELKKGLQDAVAELTDDREVVAYLLIVVDEEGVSNYSADGGTLELLGAVEITKSEIIAADGALQDDSDLDEDESDLDA
jgi:hypothetical protein